MYVLRKVEKKIMQNVRLKMLKKGEIAVALIAGVLASGAVIGYGVREVLPDGTISFVKEWVSHPSEVGAFAPCSKFVAAEIVRPLQEAIQKKNGQRIRVLEVGSGPGVLSRKIVEVLKVENADFQLDLVEINEVFCDTLRAEFTDANITVHQADITQWKTDVQYDVIISTLPFNIFDKEVIESILESYCTWLVPGGSISYVELAALARIGKFFMNAEKKEIYEEKLQVIRSFKEKHLNKTTTIFLNFLPIYVHHLTITPEISDEVVGTMELHEAYAVEEIQMQDEKIE